MACSIVDIATAIILLQLRHGERGFQMPFLAVQGDAHGHGRGRQKSKMDYNERLIVLPVVTPCTGSNAPAWLARVWFNGRTRASQALDVGSTRFAGSKSEQRREAALARRGK